MPFPPSLETDFELVEQLPDCKILEAFRVRDRRRGRAEVILRLLPAEISQTPDIVSSFHSYFTRFSDIRNRMYIPAVYSVVGTVNRNVYVLEEYVSGISLSRFIEIRQTSPTLVRDVTEVLARACEALHHAHQKDIYHACISPGDIVVDENNPAKVRLVGFGCQIFCTGKRLNFLSHQWKRCLAPEVLNGIELKPSADVFSLGKAIHGVFPQLDEQSGVLARAMSADPLVRYARPRDLAADLKKINERRRNQPTERKSSPSVTIGGLCPILRITSEPLGATVTVNDRVVGTTTNSGFPLPWKQGMRIRLEKSGYEPKILDLSGTLEETTINVILKPMPLRIITNPWGASVKINGLLIGVTGRDGLPVPRGNGEILIEKAGFKPKRLTFTSAPSDPECLLELELAGVRASTRRLSIKLLGAAVIGTLLAAVLLLQAWDRHTERLRRIERDKQGFEQELAKLRSTKTPSPKIAQQRPVGQSLNDQLMVYSCDGKLLNLENLLRRGADPNGMNSSSLTALMCASKNGHLEVVRQLLRSSADVNAKTLSGLTAEDFARANNHTDIVSVVRAHRSGQPKAQPVPQAQTRERGTLNLELWRAATKGDSNSVRNCLQNGADPNYMGSQGTTPLMEASWEGHMDIVRLLLEAGADVKSRVTGRSAVDFAKARGHRDIVRMLESHK